MFHRKESGARWRSSLSRNAEGVRGGGDEPLSPSALRLNGEIEKLLDLNVAQGMIELAADEPGFAAWDLRGLAEHAAKELTEPPRVR